MSDLTIRHELGVIDVKAAFHAAIKATPSFVIEEFSTWPLLNEFIAYRPGGNGAEVTVKPDGFIRIHEKAKDGGLWELPPFFLELDRSSEVQETLVAKAGCYLDYYRRGGFAVRKGATHDDFKKFPYRVLMVFKNTERRNNTALRLLQNNPPILTMMYLSLLRETYNKLSPAGRDILHMWTWFFLSFNRVPVAKRQAILESVNMTSNVQLLLPKAS